MEILTTDGPDELTVQAVVARAGSSVGSFYARFKGKDDLVDYLGERVWSEALDRWDVAMADREFDDHGLASLIEGSVGLLVDAERSRSAYLRVIDRARPGRHDAFSAFRAHVLAGVADLMLQRSSEIAHPQPELAVRIGLAGVIGVLDRPPVEEEGDVLVKECSAMLHAYLTTTPSATTGSDAEFFDVWG